MFDYSQVTFAMATSTPIPSLPNLVGTELADGWKVVHEFPRVTIATAKEKSGGNFSISCVAEKNAKDKPKEVAFVKVFDFTKAYAITGDLLQAATLLNTSFKFLCYYFRIS